MLLSISGLFGKTTAYYKCFGCFFETISLDYLGLSGFFVVHLSSLEVGALCSYRTGLSSRALFLTLPTNKHFLSPLPIHKQQSQNDSMCTCVGPEGSAEGAGDLREGAQGAARSAGTEI